MSSSMAPSYPLPSYRGGTARAIPPLPAADSGRLRAWRGRGPRRVGEHRELVHVLVIHRGEGEVHVLVPLGIVPDPLADAPRLPGQPRIDADLLPALDRELPVEHADRLDRHAVAAVAPVLHAQDAAFQRMDTLGLEHDLEH